MNKVVHSKCTLMTFFYTNSIVYLLYILSISPTKINRLSLPPLISQFKDIFLAFFVYVHFKDMQLQNYINKKGHSTSALILILWRKKLQWNTLMDQEIKDAVCVHFLSDINSKHLWY